MSDEQHDTPGYLNTHKTALPDEQVTTPQASSTEPAAGEASAPKQLSRNAVLIGLMVIFGPLLLWILYNNMADDSGASRQAEQVELQEDQNLPDEKVVEDAVMIAKRELEEQARLQSQAEFEKERERLREQKRLDAIADARRKAGLPPDNGALPPGQAAPPRGDAGKPDPWKQAREQYRAQRAQTYYANLAAARNAKLFFGSGTFSRGGKGAQDQGGKVSGQDPQTAAFLAQIQAVQKRGQQLQAQQALMPQGQGAPQAMQVVRTQQDQRERFFASASGAQEGAELGNPLGDGKLGSGRVMVQAGTVVHVVIETGINSDLPGVILGRTSSPVYDPSMSEVTIPAGTRLLGLYNSRNGRGDERVQVAWTSMILPSGTHLELSNFPGVDLSGMSGFEGDVDEHWDKVLAGTAVGTVFSAASAAAQGPQNQLLVRPEQSALAGASQNVNEVGQSIAERYLEVEPTITLEPGSLVGMLVTQDLAF